MARISRNAGKKGPRKQKVTYVGKKNKNLLQKINLVLDVIILFSIFYKEELESMIRNLF